MRQLISTVVSWLIMFFNDLTCSGTIMADPLPVSYPNVVMQGFTPLEA